MLKYNRISSIEDHYFPAFHQLLQSIFPPEEVLEYELWREPIQDPDIYVYVAIHDQEVVGATEYRYYRDMRVAMTDFTIIGQAGLGIGRFLLRNREKHLQEIMTQSGTTSLGMFAEVYDPYRAEVHTFGGVSPMNPIVRREVLSHVGYKKLDLAYVHPSWDHEGAAISELDLCFLPQDEQQQEISTALIVQFLTTYYTALPNKPEQWHHMIKQLAETETIALLPL
ncbi:GNAT family N-acetyltransferase [Paenibacillus yanchengensis]|uniref:GNAT family N-acetyltransferase n=1 Tax=Paenibacillus yanchengensis TaxID=2035833 RepID=A0ABW4YQ30_9BACL